MKNSATGVGELPVPDRLLLACGVLGALLNVIVMIVLGEMRPGYYALQMPDSLLELGEGGWMQIANYLGTGALMVGFAIGLRRVLHNGRGFFWVPALLGLYGLTFIGIGIFVTDPQFGFPPGASAELTVHGLIHNLLGQTQFISLTAACFVLSQRDAADPSRRGWTRYSLITGLLLAVSDVVFVFTFKMGGPAGLVERTGIVVGSLWIALLAIRLLTKKISGESI